MRAYIITSEDTAIHFLWHDDAFCERMQVFFNKAEESFHPSKDPNENITCVQAILSPVIASYMVVKENHDDRLTTISSGQMGCDVVFQEHENLLYIGFIDHDAFSLSRMERILIVLHSLTGFMFGPCQQNIKPINSFDRVRTWNRISQALQSFSFLYEEEQSFLLGCVENLHVNADIQLITSNLVEFCIKTIPLTVMDSSCYGALFVGNKILANSVLQSSKDEIKISTQDLLHILIMINSEYQEPDSMVEASSAVEVLDMYRCSTEYSSKENFDSLSDSHTNDDSNSSDTVLGTPKTHHHPSDYDTTLRPRSKSWNGFITEYQDSHSDSVKYSSIYPSRIRYYTMSQLDISRENPFRNQLTPIEIRRGNFEGPHFSSLNYRKVDEVTGNEYRHGNSDVKTFPVFLHMGVCPHSPFIMHDIVIDERISFVMLSEMKHGDIATVICNFLGLLRNIKLSFKGIHVEGGQKTIDQLTSCCNQLRSRFKKQAVTEHQIESIFSRWFNNILGHLQAPSKKDDSVIRRLEQSISELKKNLQYLFHRLFILKANKSKNQWLPHLLIIQSEIRRKLADYLEYLTAKSKRNIGLNWDRRSYPGMLHYIFVRRERHIPSTNEFLKDSRSLLESGKDDFLSATLFIDKFNENFIDPVLVRILKDEVWKGVMLAHLTLKHSQRNTFSAVEEDFRLTSFVWHDVFESNPSSPSSSSGQSILPDFDFSFARPFCRDFMQGPTEFSQTSNRRTLIIWELHFVHFSTVTEKMIQDQCKQMYDDIMNSNFVEEFCPQQNFSDIFKPYTKAGVKNM